MKRLNPTLLTYESLPSTNAEAARLAFEGAGEGLCIVSNEQTAGRGRLQRQWVSRPGAGLYFSLLLRPTVALDQWPVISLLAAIAVRDALLAVADLSTDIKWPNDILVRGKKLCGILSETVETPVGRAVILGIGINLLAQDFPASLRETAISVEEATGAKIEPEAVVEPLLSSLDHYYEVLHTVGPGKIIETWCRYSSYAQGKIIRVSLDGRTIEGRTQGLEDDGGLRVETPDGEIKIVRAGDVTAVR